MILGCILVKNGDGGKGLESLKAVCDEVYVVEDNTPNPWQVSERELRGKYIARMSEVLPDWAVTLDSDEEFSDPKTLRELVLQTSPETLVIGLVRADDWGNGLWRYRNLWDGSLANHRRFWRPKKGDFIAPAEMFGGNVPFDAIWTDKVRYIRMSECIILHHGMNTPEKRAAKKALYQKIDPGARNFGIDFEQYFDGRKYVSEAVWR